MTNKSPGFDGILSAMLDILSDRLVITSTASLTIGCLHPDEMKGEIMSGWYLYGNQVDLQHWQSPKADQSCLSCILAVHQDV